MVISQVARVHVVRCTRRPAAATGATFYEVLTGQMLPSLHMLPLGSPEHLTLDEQTSGEIERRLCDRDRQALMCVERSSAKHSGTLVLGNHRRDEDGEPTSYYDDLKWQFSMTGGVDKNGRQTYVALAENRSIRGNEQGVDMSTRFDVKYGTDIVYNDGTDEEFPFPPNGAIVLNIPEWNIKGKYFLEYGDQRVKSVSKVTIGEDKTRSFTQVVRLGFGKQFDDETSEELIFYVDLEFRCVIPTPMTAPLIWYNPPPVQYESGEDESGEDERGEDDEEEKETIQATWVLNAITVYRAADVN